MKSMNNRIFRRNEAYANKTTATCTLILAFGVLGVWLLNVVGLFVLDSALMLIATVLSIIFLLIPSLLVSVLKKTGRQVKYISCISFCIAMGILSVMLTYHVMLIWIFPVLIAANYYSRRLMVTTCVVSAVIIVVAVPLGMLFGVVDSNMLYYIEETTGQVFTFATATITWQERMDVFTSSIKSTILYLMLPRAIIAFGALPIGLTLVKRTDYIVAEQEEFIIDREKVEAEVRLAKDIQAKFLPLTVSNSNECPDIETASYITAENDNGFCFYDHYLIGDDKIAFAISEMQGTGVAESLVMLVTKILIKGAMEKGKTPAEALTEINKMICSDNEEIKVFSSIFLGLLDLKSGELCYCNGGHSAPLIKHDNSYEFIDTQPCFLVGAMQFTKYQDERVQLNPSDAIFMYTSGLIETEVSGEVFGEERLRNLLNRSIQQPFSVLVPMIKTEMNAFTKYNAKQTGHAVLVIKYNGEREC